MKFGDWAMSQIGRPLTEPVKDIVKGPIPGQIKNFVKGPIPGQIKNFVKGPIPGQIKDFVKGPIPGQIKDFVTVYGPAPIRAVSQLARSTWAFTKDGFGSEKAKAMFDRVGFAFGVNPGPRDTRDWTLDNSAGTLPKDIPAQFDLRPLIPPPKNQGSAGSCLPHACSAILECHARRYRNQTVTIGPQFIYDLRDNSGSGMTVNAAIRFITNAGSPPETVYPYRNTNSKARPCKGAAEAATYYKAQGFWRVKTVTEAKQALLAFGPALISVPVYMTAYKTQQTRLWRPNPKIANEKIVGHAMCIVGYDESGFVIRNSWGKYWNADGHVRMSFDDFEWLQKTHGDDFFECHALAPGSLDMGDPLSGGARVQYACTKTSPAMGTPGNTVNEITAAPEVGKGEKQKASLSRTINMGARVTIVSPITKVQYPSSIGFTSLVQKCADECKAINSRGGSCPVVSVHNPKYGKNVCEYGGVDAKYLVADDIGSRWATVTYK